MIVQFLTRLRAIDLKFTTNGSKCFDGVNLDVATSRKRIREVGLRAVCFFLVAVASSVTAEPSDDSLYLTSAKWTTQRSSQIELKELRGKPVVLAMAYTSCQYSCPLTIAVMKKIQATLPQSQRDKVQFVLVSLDPEQDTAEVMTQFAKKNGFESSSWTLLNGAPDDVRELAVLLGIKYQKTTSGEINHTTLIALLDREGKIVARQEGLGGDGKTLSDALRRIL